MSEQESNQKVESMPVKEHFTELVKRAILHVGGLREVEEKLKEIVRRTSRLQEVRSDEPPATD